MSVLLLLALTEGARADARLDFDRDVRPILSEYCFQCHGPDEAARKADLRLDRREGVLSAEEGELVRRLTASDRNERMPPAELGKAPTDAEIEVLRRWLDAGAPWAEHWAFVAPAAPPPPAVPDESWIRDDLDRFVAARLAREGLAPSPEADRTTWLRRVSLDLTGLPPTPEEVDAFLADDAPDAYERAVDARLTSPRRAEHLAAEWLDLARFADSNGYQNDFGRDQSPWRDWVLRAFGENLPYDEFVVQQIAGDLLPDATRDQILATGFHRNHRTVTEAGSLDEEWRVENVADRAETTAAVFLGLTLNCARCHDHKYDPLTQRDYYSLYAFFDSIDEKGVYTETRGNVPPLIQVPRPEDEARLAELDRELAAASAALEDLAAAAEARRGDWLDALRTLEAEEPGGALLAVDGAPTLAGGIDGGPVSRDELDRPIVELVGEPQSQVDLGRAVSFERDRPFTVALWANVSTAGALYSRMERTDRYRGTDLVLLGDLRPAVHLIHQWTGDAIKVVGAAPLEPEVWTHLAVTYDGSSRAAGVTLWVNGRAAEVTVEVDALTGTITADEPFRLGSRHHAGSPTGRLASLRVFDRALDEGEVHDLLLVRAAGVLAKLDASDEAWHAAAATEIADLHARVFDADLVAGREWHARLGRERARTEAALPTAMVLRDRAEPRETRILERGRYDRPVGAPLTPDVPTALGSLPGGVARDRLALARWLVDPANPLVARVVVNRTWARFFGTGLVASPEDFGTRGARPSHPELLDHLAVELVASGWDLRALERRLALSATYRQSSVASPALRERDPTNRLLARGPRHRLSAEAIRDQALFVSGLLVERLGGPSVKPYQPAGLWKELAGGAGQGAYVPSEGDDLFRRSLYTYRKRTVPHPTLSTFDAPSFEVCTVRRPRTNTPLQALALLNGPTYVEAARALGERMLAAAESDVDAGLVLGFRRATGRTPGARELELLRAALDGHLAEGDVGAAWTLVASTLQNLDEVVTKE